MKKPINTISLAQCGLILCGVLLFIPLAYIAVLALFL
jgi:hypothetical protein